MMKTISLGKVLFLVLAVLLLSAACGSTAAPTEQPTAEPTKPPTLPTELPPEPPLQPTEPGPEPTEAPTSVEPTAEAGLSPSEMPSAVRGQEIYAANCAACHGAEGDGSGLPGPADFTNVAFARGETPVAFFEAIRDGVAGTAMPTWGGTLSEMEIWDVLYYERTFATSPLEITEGQARFAENCVGCHGAMGDGSGLPGAANFTDQEFMASKKPAEFFEKITQGVEGTAMPAWGSTFTEDEIWALVNFVWTFAYEYPEEPAAPTAEPTPEPEPTLVPELPAEPDPVVGQQIWVQKPCSGCHGTQAEGGIGPMLAGTALSFDEVLLQVRTGAAPMPAFGEDEITDLEVEHILPGSNPSRHPHRRQLQPRQRCLLLAT